MLNLDSIASLLFSVLVLVSALWSRRRVTVAQQAAKRSEFLDTVQAWPPQAVRVMTLAERQAYELLRRAVPRNHMVLAQVPLSRFISVPTENPHGQWLNRAGRLSVDLLVCDPSSRVVAAIDVRGSNESKRTVNRHERLARVLKAAHVCVHTWQDGALPALADVRELFMTGMRDDSDALPQSDDRRLLPQPEMRELLLAGDRRHTNHKLEPVASDYFDDLDAVAPTARTARA
ncbi:MAG: DUF2726 domain-containing protein [Burkholderiaceae bacterium]